MERCALSVCLAVEMNRELDTMLGQFDIRLDICDSLEKAEDRIGKQRLCLIIWDASADAGEQVLRGRVAKHIGQ